MRLGSAATAALALVLVMSGACGDDGDESNRLTKEAYVAEADAACANAKTRIEENTERIPPELRAVDPFAPGATEDQLKGLAPFAAGLGDIYADLRAELAEFQPPEQDQDRINAILRGLSAGADRFKAAAQSFAKGQRLTGEPPIPAVARPSRELVEYGAGECAHSGN